MNVNFAEGVPVPPSRARAISNRQKRRAVVAPPTFSADGSDDRHPVFPVTRDALKNFDLEAHNIHQLWAWYCIAQQKRAALIEQQCSKNDALYDEISMAQGELYEVILMATPIHASEVALQLEVIAMEAREADTIAVFNQDDLTRIAENLEAVTGPIPPRKSPGPSSRGQRLTRAGLLRRYQSFLVQELETLSWNLYGSEVFAFQYRIEDDAVNGRCDPSRGTKRPDPFFDESRLTARARSVLKSLKIDTVKAGV
jgi:hypothetical protein